MNRSSSLVALAVALAVVAAFAAALGSGFAYDDFRLIVKNDALTSPGAVPAAFSGDYYSSSLDVRGIGYYRPLAVTLNVIDRAVWGLAPAGYHATNVALHVIVTLLLFAWLARLTDARWAAAAALLFAVHPTRAESVTFISGRVDVLAAAFYLGTLLALSCDVVTRRALGIAAGLAGAAILSKEMAVTVLVVAPLFVLVRPRLVGRPSPAPRRSAALTFGALFGVTLLVLALRRLAMGQVTEHALAAIPSWPARIAITLGEYLRAMVFPSWSIRLEPEIVVDRFTAATLPAVVMFVLALVLAWLARRRMPLVTFGIGAALIALMPVSQLVPLETAWGERFMYIPAALAACAVAGGAAQLAKRPTWTRPLVVALVVVGLVEFTGLQHRNRAWRSDEALWDAVMTSGQVSAKALNNRGVNLMERGELARAGVVFTRAVERDPSIATAHFNLGVIAWSSGDHAGAMSAIRRAIELRPADIDFRQRYAEVAVDAGAVDEALAAYDAVLTMDATRARAYFGRAQVHERRGDLEAALSDYRAAIRHDPVSVSPHVQSARVLATLGRWCEASDSLTEAIRIAGAGAPPELREAARALAEDCTRESR